MIVKRVLKFLVVGAAILLAVGVTVYLCLAARLRAFRTHIEAVYSKQFSLIEQRSREFDEKNFDLRFAVEEELRAIVSSNEIFSAYWSTDGHHGLDTIKPLPDGYATCPWLTSTSADNLHFLRYGRTEKGHALLIYEGEVPTGGKRVYTVAFALNDIKKQRSQQAEAATRPRRMTQ
jgi:hypothetical protein